MFLSEDFLKNYLEEMDNEEKKTRGGEESGIGSSKAANVRKYCRKTHCFVQSL